MISIYSNHNNIELAKINQAFQSWKQKHKHRRKIRKKKWEMKVEAHLPIQKEREAPRTLAEKTQTTAGKKPKIREAVASMKTA